MKISRENLMLDKLREFMCAYKKVSGGNFVLPKYRHEIVDMFMRRFGIHEEEIPGIREKMLNLMWEVYEWDFL